MSQAYVTASEQTKTAPASPIEGQKVWRCELASFVNQTVTLPEVAIQVTEVVAVYQAPLAELVIGLGGQNIWVDIANVYTEAAQPVKVEADGVAVTSYTDFTLVNQPIEDTLRHTVTVSWPSPTVTDPVTGEITPRADLPEASAKVRPWLVLEGPLAASSYALEAAADGTLTQLHITQNFNRLLPFKKLCIYYTAAVAPGFVRS